MVLEFKFLNSITNLVVGGFWEADPGSGSEREHASSASWGPRGTRNPDLNRYSKALRTHTSYGFWT